MSRSVNFLSLFTLHWSLSIFFLPLTYLYDSTHTPPRGACLMHTQTGIQFPPSVAMISCLYWKEVLLPCLYTSWMYLAVKITQEIPTGRSRKPLVRHSLMCDTTLIFLGHRWPSNSWAKAKPNVIILHNLPVLQFEVVLFKFASQLWIFTLTVWKRTTDGQMMFLVEIPTYLHRITSEANPSM